MGWEADLGWTLVGENTASAIANWTVTVPAGTVDGDLMIATCGTQTTTGWNTPSGWTKISTGDTVLGNGTATIFFRFASNEPPSYTFVASPSTTHGECSIATVRGPTSIGNVAAAQGFNVPTDAPSVALSAQTGVLRVFANRGSQSPTLAGGEEMIIQGVNNRWGHVASIGVETAPTAPAQAVGAWRYVLRMSWSVELASDAGASPHPPLAPRGSALRSRHITGGVAL